MSDDVDDDEDDVEYVVDGSRLRIDNVAVAPFVGEIGGTYLLLLGKLGSL